MDATRVPIALEGALSGDMQHPELSMPQEAFRAFHESTSRPLLGYVSRLMGSPETAEDLVQESYLRLLKADIPAEADFQYRRNYLYKIATNLARDHFRGRSWEELPDLASPVNLERSTTAGHDVHRILSRLPMQDRALLWMFHVEQFSQREIAAVLRVKEESVRTMVFRAKKRFQELMK